MAAGGAVRSAMELAGIDDVTSKRLGSNTPINAIPGNILVAWSELKSAEEISALRGVSTNI